MIIIRNPNFDWNWRFCQKWWNLALLSVISIWFISQKLSRRPTLFNWLKPIYINNGISFTSEFRLDWSARSPFKVIWYPKFVIWGRFCETILSKSIYQIVFYHVISKFWSNAEIVFCNFFVDYMISEHKA